jgi:hypothetical protein
LADDKRPGGFLAHLRWPAIQALWMVAFQAGRENLLVAPVDFERWWRRFIP